MRIRGVGVALAAVAVFVSACSSAPRAGGGRLQGDVITAEDIRRSQAVTTFDAIQRLRPQALERRERAGPVSIVNAAANRFVVYADNVRLGDVSELNGIPASDVERIEILNASQATNRFGTGHSGGAIVVHRRTR